MKPGDLISVSDGVVQAYDLPSDYGLVLSAHPRRIFNGLIHYEITVMFSDCVFHHPSWPESLFEVISGTG